MTTQTVLIAGLSGRALAQSARRAGFAPLVVDAFGDADMRDTAAASRCIPEAMRSGFRAGPLLAALDALAGTTASAPVGLVLGSGFEDTPKLVETLARRYRLLGNGGEQIAGAKDPVSFFSLLDKLAVAHPETLLAPPASTTGWLSKRVGGSGGAHILACEQAKTRRGRYFQRRLEGDAVSVLVIARRDGAQVAGFSRQWCVGAEPRPCRYGGAVGPIRLDVPTEAAMIDAAQRVCRALGLIGLVSFDFLLSGGIPHLLEVNPRPGATLDVFDDAEGTLFRAHLTACAGHPGPLPATLGCRAAAILYAGREAITPGAVAWPLWTADRPRPGTRTPPYRPIATVLANDATAEGAERNCHRRLDELAEMLYARTADREPKNAKIHRSRSERLGPGGQAR